MEKKEPKTSLAQQLAARKLRRPPALLYWTLAGIWRLIFVRRLGVSFRYLVDPKKFTGPYIVVSNHASRADYIYTGIPFLPHRLNFVAGYNEFFRSHLALVFRLLQVIPKKNFTPDPFCVRAISRILRSGGRVCIFPEGMSSISGANQPVALGSAKLLKHFGVPVLFTHIAGGYLSNTKHCLDERRGRVEVVIGQLFTREELSRLSEEEITLRLHAAIKQDDYAWNKEARVRYRGKSGMADHLNDMLYLCPRCKAEYSMHAEGNIIQCRKCRNGARINEYYDLEPLDIGHVLPDTPRHWFDMQREAAAAAVREEGFSLQSRVQLGMLPEYTLLKKQATSEIVGEGVLTLDHSGLCYKGTRRGEEVELRLTSDLLPTYGMCTDMSRFYTFFEGEFHEFYPGDGRVCKWLLCTEELHRFQGGKWQNFPDAATRYRKWK